jgi:hypothetical protein
MPDLGNNVKRDWIWIRLTERQNEIVLWAVEGQRDYFDYLRAHGELPQMPPLPGTDGTYLMLPPYEEIIADILYRLESEFQDMTNKENTVGARADARVAMRVVDKIRDAISPIQWKTKPQNTDRIDQQNI